MGKLLLQSLEFALRALLTADHFRCWRFHCSRFRSSTPAQSAFQRPESALPRTSHFFGPLVARFQSVPKGYFVSLKRSCASVCSHGTFLHCSCASWSSCRPSSNAFATEDSRDALVSDFDMEILIPSLHAIEHHSPCSPLACQKNRAEQLPAFIASLGDPDAALPQELLALLSAEPHRMHRIGAVRVPIAYLG
jgi:hypothetical protein